ncbi:hypothetical protein [Streptomyces sp. NPDC003327]
MSTSGNWRRRAAGVVAAVTVAVSVVGCQGDGKGRDGSEAKPSKPGASSRAPGQAGGGGKESATPSGSPSSSGKPRDRGPSRALTCEQLRNAELQNAGLRLPDAPEGTIRLSDGRWEGDGLLIELQPQCAIGDLTGDASPDAVAAVKVTTEGTGRFYGLVTWRNDGGTPVPAAAAALGDRTPVESVTVAAAPARRATVVYLTRHDTDPTAVVTIRRTAVHRVVEPAMVELSHSDAPYTP